MACTKPRCRRHRCREFRGLSHIRHWPNRRSSNFRLAVGLRRNPELSVAKPTSKASTRLFRMPTTSVQPSRRWHNLLVADMNIDENAVLRLRICGHAACRAVFTICIRCDRGQRYCSPECRSEVRRRQRHDANRRYQQSEPGRESHRRCQKRYRDRALRLPVTDHGAAVITPPAPPQPPTMCQCTICGRHSLWIDPFPAIPRRYRSARRSENYVFR